MGDRRRRQPPNPPEWPPVLRRVVLAADRECPAGHAHALRELTTLALASVPARGIFDPSARGEDDLFAAIEAVALAHLQLASARRAWHAALRAAEMDMARRDRVERAALELQTISDTAYYYAGLAFGLVATSCYR